MRRMRFSPRSSFARTLLLIVTLLFVSLVTTYLVVLNFAILPSLQQFNKVLAYEVRMLMTDKLQLEDGTQLVVPPAFRREIYRELGISLYTNEAAEEAGLRWAQHYEFLSHQMAQQLGGPTEVRVEVNKSSPVVWLKTWLSPNIWVRVPLTEIHQGDFSPLFRYTPSSSQPCSSSPIRRRFGSVDRVVFPVPERPKKTATSPFSPTLAEQCIEAIPLSGSR